GTARYLHILRDPRDVAASWLKLKRLTEIGLTREQMLVRICYLWSVSARHATRDPKAAPGRYHVLRYEDLVSHPRDTMSAVCRFLDVDPDEGLLTPTRIGERIAANSSYPEHARSLDVISSAGRFRDAITADEERFIETLLRRQMRAFNYDVD